MRAFENDMDIREVEGVLLRDEEGEIIPVYTGSSYGNTIVKEIKYNPNNVYFIDIYLEDGTIWREYEPISIKFNGIEF